MSYQAIVHTPVGKLGLKSSNKGITRLDFLPLATVLILPATPLLQAAVSSLSAYFSNPCSVLSELLDVNVTPFQQKVLSRLQEIPFGSVCTYGQIAQEVGGSARAVGNACRNNPIPLFIPCHRVVAATHLGGFCGARTGEAMVIKQWLLQHEGYSST